MLALSTKIATASIHSLFRCWPGLSRDRLNGKKNTPYLTILSRVFHDPGSGLASVLFEWRKNATRNAHPVVHWLLLRDTEKLDFRHVGMLGKGANNEYP